MLQLSEISLSYVKRISFNIIPFHPLAGLMDLFLFFRDLNAQGKQNERKAKKEIGCIQVGGCQ